jgi:6-pyruvoyltetrahydropterin/6-carboxytetrahydropterin synthase
MPYRVCKSFTVESGHMLSKHPERCRFPHGHTRVIEVVLEADTLDTRDMVADFKAIKLMVGAFIERFDHAMAIHADDPLRADLERVHPGSTVVFHDADPTTEVLAREIFRHAAERLTTGFSAEGYTIDPARVRLRRVRVGETPSSWAEFEG